jgi:hypothetical protein
VANASQRFTLQMPACRKRGADVADFNSRESPVAMIGYRSCPDQVLLVCATHPKMVFWRQG